MPRLIVDAWSALPELIRAGILATVKAVRFDSERGGGQLGEEGTYSAMTVPSVLNGPTGAATYGFSVTSR